MIMVNMLIMIIFFIISEWRRWSNSHGWYDLSRVSGPSGTCGGYFSLWGCFCKYMEIKHNDSFGETITFVIVSFTAHTRYWVWYASQQIPKKSNNRLLAIITVECSDFDKNWSYLGCFTGFYFNFWTINMSFLKYLGGRLKNWKPSKKFSFKTAASAIYLFVFPWKLSNFCHRWKKSWF